VEVYEAVECWEISESLTVPQVIKFNLFKMKFENNAVVSKDSRENMLKCQLVLYSLW